MAEKKVNTTNEEEKKKKKKLFIIFGSILGAGAIAGASVGIYFAVKPKAKAVKVDVPEINGLMFSNQKAYVGHDYNTNISVNKDLTDLLLPDTLKEVTSGNRTVLPTEYTYTVEDNKEKGSLHIPGKYIEGDVTIDLELVSSAPNYFCFTNIGDSTANVVSYFTHQQYGTTSIDDCLPNLRYSFNNKKDLSEWDELQKGEEQSGGDYAYKIPVEPLQSVYFCGENADTGLQIDLESYLFHFIGDSQSINGNDKFAISGNISSLVYGEDFENKNDVPVDKCYQLLFSENSSIVTAKDLILPTNVNEKQLCFYGMFMQCENLECAPYLGVDKDQITQSGCYNVMFTYCKKLKEVRVNFGLNNEWPEGIKMNGSATDGWLSNAGTSATDPTFYWLGEDDPDRSKGLVEEDGDYVPSGWKVLHWE